MGSTISPPPIALTMGEPAGIGGEIAIKCWHRRSELPLSFFIIDDAGRLKDISQKIGLKTALIPIENPAEAVSAFNRGLPVLHRKLPAEQPMGRPIAANAPQVKNAIEEAVDFVKAGTASAIVTNPIHKQALYEAGFSFPGHTEFLAHLANISTPPVMMLACPKLRVVPVTIHVSLEQAINSLKTDSIVETTQITAHDLTRHFGIKSPRLAIAGINPHAGEGGAMGHEEIDIIQPAIGLLKNQGLNITGPLPPDTMFSDRARETYDAAICMYHDQALIPIKTLDFDGGVNITLGLPFIRTSPDHGTAFDIAGTGQASEKSLLAALNMAADMVLQQPRILKI